MGENLINTSRQSSLYGENSTLTGDNVSKEELNHLINTQSDKIQARNNKQQELDRTATNISTNQLDQDTIRRRIELLKEANREATRKADQLQSLNNQKSTKEQELNALRQALESAKADATNQTTYTDRTVWSNFENQLRTLNWNKLTESNGVDQLANELKAKVENDFPTITKYDVEKYKPLINGYVNSKGVFGRNKDSVLNKKQETHLLWQPLDYYNHTKMGNLVLPQRLVNIKDKLQWRLATLRFLIMVNMV